MSGTDDKVSNDATTLMALPARELKQILTERKIDFSDCVEKADLVQRIIDNEARAPKITPHKIVEWTKELGGLTCFGVESSKSEEPYKLALISCHGFGASKEDLVPIGRALVQNQNFPRSLVVCPDGVLSLGGTSRAWWNLDMGDLMMKVLSGQVDAIFDSDFNGDVQKARATVISLIEEVKKLTGLPTSKIVLAGFSQGAMLMTDVALHLEESPAALVIFSGVLINRSQLRTRASSRKGLKVLQCHGTQDPLLSFPMAQVLKTFLEKEVEADLEFVPFQGGHTIDGSGLSKFQQLLTAVAKIFFGAKTRDREGRLPQGKSPATTNWRVASVGPHE
ncbi:phospholipase/carboxylesterase [Planoprotostelium fungivorum]|uniref:Phospholipase/carboxylesterase n=1 Tax=Planoprotostelium fungivorum TaxID=1890364 RepID=A0A2P6N4N8_9EUKA|nr:phospholipase/carboxylesterase [Planoprotostelium fungivorum]